MNKPQVLLAVLFIVLCIGFLGGWIARDVFVATPSSPAASTGLPLESGKQSSIEYLLSHGRFAELASFPTFDFSRFKTVVAHLPLSQQEEAVAAWQEVRGEGFGVLIAISEIAARQARWQSAVDHLLAAAVYVKDEQEQRQLEALLASAISDFGKQLAASNRLDQLDRVYEQVTLALPELPDYFLQLGLLRIRLGNFDAALGPLSQIQNHSSLGPQARELIAQAEASQAFQSASLEELPLRAAGSQYVVEALVDDQSSIALLIDTGAAMTVVDAGLLERLGYSLDGPREYFSTAGGVVDAPVITLTRLSLGGSGISQLPVGALNLDLPRGIDGLLGMNFLRHFEFRIDQEDELLHLENAR